MRKWHKRCRDPKKSADDILDLALKALDDAHGGGRALLARGAGERTAALLLRAAARKMRTAPPATAYAARRDETSRRAVG